MRKIKITNINASASVPGTIEVTGNWTNIFEGKFYRNEAGTRQAAYAASVPEDYALIAATQFDLIQNSKYSGRYTVYTPTSGDDYVSSSFNPTTNLTTIRVNELVKPLKSGEPTSLLSDGFLTNISTYLLDTGTAEVVVPPGVSVTDFSIALMGRGVSGWGEAYAQNFLNIARTFAGGIAPENPLVGQQWYNTDEQQLRIFDGAEWDLVNRTSTGITARHTQSSPSEVWNVNHLLGLQPPYIAFAQFFVERETGPKMILPADVSFTGPNTLVVTFSQPETGYVLVR